MNKTLKSFAIAGLFLIVSSVVAASSYSFGVAHAVTATSEDGCFNDEIIDSKAQLNEALKAIGDDR